MASETRAKVEVDVDGVGVTAARAVGPAGVAEELDSMDRVVL